MPINDYNGTSWSDIGKIYDYDGTTWSQIAKAYDNDGTTDTLIYSAEKPIFDNGIVDPYTPTVYIQDNFSSENGYHVNFREEGATIGDYLEVRHNSTYAVSNEWYSNNGRIDISGIDASDFSTVKFEFSTYVVSTKPNLYVKWNDTKMVTYSETTSGTGSFAITSGSNEKLTISCESTNWNSKGDYLRITKIWLE